MESKANAQTKASAKWNKKAGYIAKSYKLKKETVEEFAKACEKAGVSQAGQLTKMMLDFAKEIEKK
ncbi:MAG: chemotaxis protein [Anaerostipes hadrus]|nr:chemotaxis protein [Anaerostipes hadrus]